MHNGEIENVIKVQFIVQHPYKNRHHHPYHCRYIVYIPPHQKMGWLMVSQQTVPPNNIRILAKTLKTKEMLGNPQEYFTKSRCFLHRNYIKTTGKILLCLNALKYAMSVLK